MNRRMYVFKYFYVSHTDIHTFFTHYYNSDTLFITGGSTQVQNDTNFAFYKFSFTDLFITFI